MIGSKDFDFSFSGLKAAIMREVKKTKKMDEKTKINIAACVQKSIIEVLTRKTLKAAKKYNVKSIVLGGGVSANQKLRDEFKLKIKNSKLRTGLFFPKKNLCTVMPP